MGDKKIYLQRIIRGLPTHTAVRPYLFIAMTKVARFDGDG